MSSALQGAVLALALASTACAGSIEKFPLKEPVWRDSDRHAFAKEPEEYFSPFAWDGANQLVFRPVSRFLAVDPLGEATNVNSVDEVPDSSWFRNRIGLPFAKGGPEMPLDEFENGACVTEPLDPAGPWTVTGAKPNGFNPGFIIKAANGFRYLIKFDGTTQGVRPTAADVIGSRIYHAAGFYTPCNRVVYFDRGILQIDPEAKGENADGDEEPLTQRHLDTVFSKAQVLPDGRYRAATSLFIDGKPLGPWTYEGKRSDDPNDVIDHEMRRELRGAYVLAAWTNHFDSREQNTLSAWVKDPKHAGLGYVRHYYIDFGDCFGSIWEPPLLGRRIGNAYYLDFPYLFEDFLTLGLQERPWDTARFGKSGPVFGYYDVEHFYPDKYRPGYPNPGMVAMTERDAAWMTRILAKFDDAHVRALVESGDLRSDLLEDELTRILIGRRDKLLRRYLGKLSPFANPQVDSGKLCVEDVGVAAHVAPRKRKYQVTAFVGELLQSQNLAASRTGGKVCVSLPTSAGASAQSPEYLIVDLTAVDSHTLFPTRVHLYQLGPRDFRVVGLERPESLSPPG
ncbi:MAG: hypothetical protein H6716_02725 [Polyangiaceae bacterium]|nr:hypothetical protein [Polyangiaceae bacterium]